MTVINKRGRKAESATEEQVIFAKECFKMVSFIGAKKDQSITLLITLGGLFGKEIQLEKRQERPTVEN